MLNSMDLLLYIVLKTLKLNLRGGGITINSSPLSNLLGLYQRTIIIARYGGKITIGKKSGISGSTIYSMKSITIGEHCTIGANCKIIDNDFHPLEWEHRRKGLNEKYARRKPITIGNDCFIGANSLVLKGTKLGNNVIVGAGSVVSGTFPSNVIIAGNPAKIIKEINATNI
jgi:acetyltransferase-like isoleucine patch superfamily enzyme